MSQDNIIRGDQNVFVPAHLNFGKFILDQLRCYGDKLAIENAETDEMLTYKEMTEYSVKLSIALTKLGMRSGDVVGLGTEKQIKILPTALAVVMSGATYTPYSITYGKAQLRHMIQVAKPKYFICSELFWSSYKEILENFVTVKTIITMGNASGRLISVVSLISSVGYVDVDQFEPADVQGQVQTALVLYSSGTTGMPKGVQITHLNCILYSLPKEPLFSENTVQKAYFVGGWYHSRDLFMTLKLLALGKTVVYTNSVAPETLITAFEKAQVNLVFLLPTFISLLSKTEVKPNENLECFKYVYCGSAPVLMSTLEKMKERFPSIHTIYQGYGLCETFELTSLRWSTKGMRMGSVGHVHPCYTLKVENPDTKEVLGPNHQGEICLKGPGFMKGYIDVDISTYVDEEGWFRSGDLGYYDEDGYFYIIDRLKEIIIYDGCKITPCELETILLLHPGVREAGVVGKPVPVHGEEPTAFVVPQPGATITEQELINFVAAEVDPQMQLKGGVRFVPELPRNSIGKLMRTCLRDMLNEV